MKMYKSVSGFWLLSCEDNSYLQPHHLVLWNYKHYFPPHGKIESSLFNKPLLIALDTWRVMESKIQVQNLGKQTPYEIKLCNRQNKKRSRSLIPSLRLLKVHSISSPSLVRSTLANQGHTQAPTPFTCKNLWTDCAYSSVSILVLGISYIYFLSKYKKWSGVICSISFQST